MYVLNEGLGEGEGHIHPISDIKMEQTAKDGFQPSAIEVIWTNKDRCEVLEIRG